MDIAAWDTSNQIEIVISLAALRHATTLFGFTGVEPIGFVISFGSPANQTCLGQSHVPPLETVIADRSFQQFDRLAGFNFPNELLVDPRSAPDVVVGERWIRADECIRSLYKACGRGLWAIQFSFGRW